MGRNRPLVPAHFGGALVIVGLLASGASSRLSAQSMMMSEAATTNTAPSSPSKPAATAKTAPAAPTVAVNSPGKGPLTNAAPTLPPDTLSRYGKILAPSDEVSHPLKLRLPFPGVGEVKIPSNDELTMREKLEQLAALSDADIRTQLDKWPPYSKMNLRDQGAMLGRIQDFRDFRSNTAKTKAHEMGLLTLLPDQQARFEKEYWDARLKMDRDLARQFQPIYQAQEQQLKDKLFREYSSISSGPMVQVPAPVPPKAPAPASVAANKPAPTPVPAQPIAQAPH
jgi:hypothetical protein